MHDTRNASTSPAERKKQLIAEGALFRHGISYSRNAVRNNLNPNSLVRNVIGHFFGAAQTGFGGADALGLKGISLQKVLPLAIGGFSFLSRKGLLKPVLKGGLAVGAIAGIAALIYRGRARKAQRYSAHI